MPKELCPKMHASICGVDILNIFISKRIKYRCSLFPMKFFFFFPAQDTFLSHFFRKLWAVEVQFFEHSLCIPRKESGCAEFGTPCILLSLPICNEIFHMLNKVFYLSILHSIKNLKK